MATDMIGRFAPHEHKPHTEHRRLHEMYFPKHLLSVIRRERARADRQKSQFSLVMFRLVPAKGRWATLRLCKIVLDQIRATDEIGQFDRHTVCAILPDTDPEGAWKLIDRVHASAGQRGMKVEPVIYAYPTNWFEDRNKKNKDDSDDDASRPGGGRGAGVADWVRKAEDQNSRKAQTLDTLPLETLLERRPSAMKRALDVFTAGSVLLVASPVMIAIAAAIKLTSDGPIIFKQWRSGLGGRPLKSISSERCALTPTR